MAQRRLGDRYEVGELLGRGGMAEVHLGRDLRLGRSVAVKSLRVDLARVSSFQTRFRREARAMSHLSHPNTARVFLYGQLEDGACYFVMEHLVGRNLAQEVRASGPMSIERAIPIMVQVCGALEEAHRAGIIHRDLKPENIFLTTQGGIEDFPKVLDFGLAKVTEKQMRPGSMMLTREGMVFGTPEFMSPEQAQGNPLDARSDLYSLGVILYELLTGKLPFDAKHSMEFIKHQVSTPPIPISERVPGLTFPRPIEAVMEKALAKDPNRRFASAAEMGEALEAALREATAMKNGEVSEARHTPAGEPERPTSVLPAGLPRAAWIVLAVGAALFVGGIVALIVALKMS